jgi:hypothetical protein
MRLKHLGDALERNSALTKGGASPGIFSQQVVSAEPEGLLIFGDAQPPKTSPTARVRHVPGQKEPGDDGESDSEYA